MPELPEVETTRRGLCATIQHDYVEEMTIFQPRLRYPIDSNLPQILAQQPLLDIQRRGKYLIWVFPQGYLIIHLGMTGSIRTVQATDPLLKHDHVQWRFHHHIVRYHDPRRFGLIVWTTDIHHHPLLQKLGVEPFSEHFTADYLYQSLRSHKTTIKSVLLAGHIVVGVGNIYCSESLFLAGIRPTTPANRISRKRCIALHQAIQTTLRTAIAAGGSTISDYTNANGEAGSYFTLHAWVYGKSVCKRCGSAIKRIIQGQRASFYCPKCQHY